MKKLHDMTILVFWDFFQIKLKRNYNNIVFFSILIFSLLTRFVVVGHFFLSLKQLCFKLVGTKDFTKLQTQGDQQRTGFDLKRKRNEKHVCVHGLHVHFPLDV